MNWSPVRVSGGTQLLDNKMSVNFAATLDPYALDKFDEKHSGGEERWIILGKSLDETLLLVVHTYRNAKGVEFIRIISARKASKNEREAYNRRCVKWKTNTILQMQNRVGFIGL